MVGVFLLAHSDYANSLLEASTHILGSRHQQFMHMGVLGSEDTEATLALAQQKVDSVNDGSGVIILTDIFGATPANLACRLLRPNRVIAVAGLNLPMLLKVLSVRASTNDLEELAKIAIDAGKKGVSLCCRRLAKR